MPRILQFEINCSKEFCQLGMKRCEWVEGGLLEPTHCGIFHKPLMNEFDTFPCGMLGTPKRLAECLARDKGVI